MIRIPLTISLLLASPLPSQEANEITFTLVTEDGFNEMAVTAGIGALAQSSDTSILTGTLTAILNINEATNQTDTLTFIKGELQGTDVTLSANSIIVDYDVSTDKLKAVVETPNPPGIVTPASGDFEADQHSFTVQEGTLSGTANDEPIDFDFEADPFIGMGSGTGNIVITPSSRTVDKQFYDVSFTNPVSIEDAIETGILAITADITMNATLKAAGTAFIERADYANWAATNLGTSDEPGDLSLDQVIPNGLIYALGFDAINTPQNIFAPNGDGFHLKLAEAGTREEIVVEWSTDLLNWEEIPEDKMLEGSSYIPIGSNLIIIAGPGDEETRYYRVRMVFD